MSDLKKFMDFFNEMGIEYDLGDGIDYIHLGINGNNKHLIEDIGSYNKSLNIVFDRNEHFIGFEPWGE